MNRKIYSLFSLLLFSTVLNAQLSGVYTINNTASTSGTNFASFTDAINTLNLQGVGPAGVTFSVYSGQTFNERPPILYATGTSSAPIIFKKYGSLANPVIIPSVAGTISISTSISGLGTNGDAVIRISGSDYITFDGIDIGFNSSFSGTTQNYEYGYLLLRNNATDACQNITIKNATITLQSSMPNSVGIYTSNLDSTGIAVTATATSGRVENILFRKNTITNAYIGIALKGYAATSSPYDLFDHFATIDSNTIQGYGGSSIECYGIYLISQDSAMISDNTITSASTAASTYGIRPAAAINASLFILRNTISLTTTSGGAYGIDNAAGGTGSGNTIEISYNKVTNCTISSGSIYCIRGAASANIMNISNNEISYITNSGTGTTYAIYSIPSGSSTISKVFQNHVHHITNSNTTNTTSLYLYICNTALETHLYQNNFHDFVHNGTAGNIYGRSNTPNFYYYNNTVSRLYTPNSTNADAINAIQLNTGSTNQKVFFNTVYLDSSSTSTSNYGNSCLYINTNVAAEVRNNILVNKSIPGPTGGYICAYRRSSTTLTSYDILSNNNCFYADTLSTRSFVYADGSNFLNINAYKNLVGTTRDSASFFELPPFINTSAAPYDLGLSSTNTLCSDGGSTVTSPIAITTDQAGALRNNPPDVGAFEINQLLPLSYLKLMAETAGNDVVLKWLTANEVNNKGFYIERSTDGRNFESIAFVNATGTPTSQNSYVQIDNNVMNFQSVYYYRIRQTDYNAEFTYSNVVKVSKHIENTLSDITLYPNPFSKNPSLSFTAGISGNATLEITDISGRLVSTSNMIIEEGQNTIVLHAINNLHNGAYFAKVSIAGISQIIKLIKVD